MTEGPRPDLVLCSDAQRARHTWEIVASRLAATVPVRLDPSLYGATPGEIVIETLTVSVSERGATRMDDKTSDASMEKRKKDGYLSLIHI